jgi:hypothetical protein
MLVRPGGVPAALVLDPEAHDAWFRAKVQEALDDTRPAVPHRDAMANAAFPHDPGQQDSDGVRHGEADIGERLGRLGLEAEAHDAWFRAKVQEALDDTRPAVPHRDAMAEVQADPGQQDSDGVRHGEADIGERLGRLGLEAGIDADMAEFRSNAALSRRLTVSRLRDMLAPSRGGSAMTGRRTSAAGTPPSRTIRVSRILTASDTVRPTSASVSAGLGD